jgi:signal transduction histidine kinase
MNPIKKIFPPHVLLLLSSIGIIAVALLAIYTAVSAPHLQPEISLKDDRLVIERSHGVLEPIDEFITPQGRITAEAYLALGEPDGLPDYHTYNLFFKQQQQLDQAIQQQQLQVKTASAVLNISSEPNGLTELPFMFWFQVFVGVAGALTGVVVYSFSQSNRATFFYLLTGFGYLIFAPSAAIYSTRDLVLNGDLFKILSLTNHFGALFFTAALTALLWSYPKPIGKQPIPLITFIVALLFWGMHAFQLWPSISLLHLAVLSLFVIGIVFGIIQWRQARKNPIDRASFRWFILSIMLGTGLFAGFVIIPSALGFPLTIEQGWMFGAFLMMYWGLALGLLRYRLFDLETWWFSIWAWFLSGLSILLVDIFLISFLSLTEHTALIAAVALTGWLYFPLRQWALSSVQRGKRQNVQDWMPHVLPLLLETRAHADQERQIRQRWRDILKAVFDPLFIENSPLRAHTIAQHGQQLIAPDLTHADATDSIALNHGSRGQRLFNRKDIEALNALVNITQLALSVARARDTGAQLERERIARDIHDDLGARLLSLLQQSTDNQQHLIREILDDVRHLLSSLDGEDIFLEDAIATWRAEVSERLSSKNIQLHWNTELLTQPILTAFEFHHLTRILREAVTNALKHSSLNNLYIHVYSLANLTLYISIENDGAFTEAGFSTGRGVQNMARRAKSLNGNIDWQYGQRYKLFVEVKLSNAGIPLPPH